MLFCAAAAFSQQGQVLFHNNAEQEQQQNSPAKAPRTPELVISSITAEERAAILFTSRSLDLHVTLATSNITVRADLAVTNTSSQPLKRITLQLSSTLHWETIASGGTPLPFTEHTLLTDVDHTGSATEALVTLPTPLPPGGSLRLHTLYSGRLATSAQRLTRIGAPPEQAIRADWDAVTPLSIALRGLGNVLWYPVSSNPLFLGDGAKLFHAIGLSRRSEEKSLFATRLTIEYQGEPPAEAYLNGHRLDVTHHTEEPDVPVAESHGVATANSPSAPLGFLTPSLFVAWNAVRPSENNLLAVVTTRPEAIPPYNAATDNVAPLLRDWLGPSPLAPLTLIDHSGQPYEEGPLLVIPLTLTDSSQIAPSIVHSLAHAWFRSSLPWLNEGVPQFMALLHSEAADGRDTTLARLRNLITPLTLAEPEPPAPTPKPQQAETPATEQPQTNIPFDPRNLPGPPQSYSSSGSSSSSSPANSEVEDKTPPQPLAATQPPPPGQAGQSLIAAHDEVYYRAKAAAVLVMLRSVVGDDALKQALIHYRDYAKKATMQNPEDPHAFQRMVEEAAHRDLSRLFDDWVYNDRGLADLSIVNVTPRVLTSRNGKDLSWLVSVEIHNSGAVEVEVPVTVRSGSLTTTDRVKIGPQSSLSTRIVFQGTPGEVVLNDGTIPETAAPFHRYALQLPAANQ